MDKQEREELKKAVSERVKERADTTPYLDCDPETLTKIANEAFEDGQPEVGEALINFRDNLVNVLLGEGWTVARIEAAFARAHKKI